MKRLHRPDLFTWSSFDESRDIDFNSVAWIRPGGNVLIDPLPLSDHDRAHLRQLGGAALVIVTNGDHTRAAEAIAKEFSAALLGPRAERDSINLPCKRWLADGDEPVPGLRVFELHGSKTPGELALVLEGTTLITGDLIRAHAPNTLHLLPEAKLTDRAQAIASVKRLADACPQIHTVLVGDGWPLFQGGAQALAALAG